MHLSWKYYITIYETWFLVSWCHSIVPFCWLCVLTVEILGSPFVFEAWVHKMSGGEGYMKDLLGSEWCKNVTCSSP